MKLELMLCDASAQADVLTGIWQTNYGSPSVGCFLNGRFQISANVIFVSQSWDTVVMDILLGARMYRLRGGEPAALNITVFTNVEDGEFRRTVLHRIIQHTRNNGSAVHIALRRNPGNPEEAAFCSQVAQYASQLLQRRKANIMEQKLYELECPSFDAFLQDHEKIRRTADSRSSALDFAHPVDANIIRILDSPLVNKAFSGLIDLTVDAQYGLVLSTGLRVDNQENELGGIVRDCAKTLGINVPYTVISSSIAGLNAKTIGTDEFVYIAISSLMQRMFEDNELRFVIGHECGHVALGHVLYHTVVNALSSFSQLIPVVGPAVYQMIAWPLKAWSRRSEISADRAGLYCCGDVNIACRTLLRLEAGFTSVEALDVQEYIQNTNDMLRHSQIGHLAELFDQHPIIAKRMEALLVFANSEKYYRLTGKTPPAGAVLYDDAELDRRTEQIVSVAF